MKTILVVDDEPTIRQLVVDVLRDAGYAAIGVEDGLRAVALMEDEAPGLVLLDMMMPGLDGRGVVRWMHERETLADVPVVLMSAAIWIGSAALGAGFVPKPFDLGLLLAAVEDALRRASPTA